MIKKNVSYTISCKCSKSVNVEKSLEEAKDAAKKCVNSELVHLMSTIDKDDVAKVAEFRELAKKYVDVTSQWYISHMIWAIEHDLADGRNCGLNSLNSICQVRDTLSADSYWEKVWHKEQHLEEAKNLIVLRDRLTILLTKASS